MKNVRNQIVFVITSSNFTVINQGFV